MFKNLWQKRDLIRQITKREIENRYRGSILGVFWSLLNPLLMLAVYTFVFGVVFRARWNISTSSSPIEFALILFCGLSAYNVFAETVSRAPSVITSNPNYVKKVVFPLEILPVTLLGSALVNAAMAFLLLILANGLFFGVLPWTIIYLPVVLVPLILLSLGASWILASLGVYLRDIGQIIPITVSVLMFLSPIFYPLEMIPEKFRWAIYSNPITYVVEDMRHVIMWGQHPNFYWLFFGTIGGLVFAKLGYTWFQKTRSGFADVI